MTFPARLTELLEKAKAEPSIGSYEKLRIYLGNHAEAIRDLVVAAENYLKHGTEPDCEALAQALAKLGEA